jgi:ribose-phosphate pyrophosphokinase
MSENILIFSGSSNAQLAQSIVGHLDIKLGEAQLSRFSDGEIMFQSLENVRGADVFVIQSMCSEINTNIMELLLMADAFKRASAKRITAVITYYAYARQDRKDRPRVSISARLLADLLETAGFSRILTIDLHATQIQGFFNIPVDNLMALPVFIDFFKTMKLKIPVIVSPDAGGVERARIFSQKLNADLAVANKKRPAPNVSKLTHIIGDVVGKDAIIVDDIIDTAGTICETVNALQQNGAKRIFAVCTHGIFSGQAYQRISNSALEKIYTTDTIPVRDLDKVSGKIEVLSVAKLFAEAIKSIHEETSVSKLFL